MLDDLRNSAGSEFIEEDPLDESAFEEAGKKKKGSFLGMTAIQRFVISLFLFLMIGILGVFILIVFQKIYPLL